MNPKQHHRLLNGGIGFVGWYRNGLPHGPTWMETMGGGLQHGTVSAEDHTLSGSNVSFIYPDYDTMFYGEFKDRMMVGARWASLEAVRCEHGIPVVKKVKLALEETVYFYQPMTNETFGGGPMGKLDPYERKNLEIRQSEIPNSGEGKY